MKVSIRDLLWLTVVCALGLDGGWTALRLAVRARQRDESQAQARQANPSLPKQRWVMPLERQRRFAH